MNWKLNKITRLNRKAEKKNTNEQQNADIDNFCLLRSSRGQGMTQLELSFKTSVTGVSEYVNLTKTEYSNLIN